MTIKLAHRRMHSLPICLHVFPPGKSSTPLPDRSPRLLAAISGQQGRTQAKFAGHTDNSDIGWGFTTKSFTNGCDFFNCAASGSRQVRHIRQNGAGYRFLHKTDLVEISGKQDKSGAFRSLGFVL